MIDRIRPAGSIGKNTYIVGTFDEIIRTFKRGRPGLMAKIGQPFTVEQLKTISCLDFEVAYVTLHEGKFLVRGNKNRVEIPKGARCVFHSHPGEKAENSFPSGLDYIGKNEAGIILSSVGMLFVLYNGHWSRNSADPFQRAIISALGNNHHRIVAAELRFHANYAERSLPMVLIPWEILLETPTLALLQAREVKRLLPSVIGDRTEKASPAGWEGWRITRSSGDVTHPTLPHIGKTGSFELVTLEKK